MKHNHPPVLRYTLLALALPLASCTSLHPQPVSEKPQAAAEQLSAPSPAKLQSWRDARFGMFIHWGPVSLKGTEIGWSRGQEVPIEEYDNLYKQFNPTKFDADQWASVAKAAGMKYVVLVTKHHDGFCMWDTRQTDYNIMNSAYHQDIVKAVAKAFRKQGIAFGVYHSVCDWHHPDFPLTSPGGSVKRETSDLDRYNAYLKAQVKELIDNYGPLYLMWFDVPQMFDKQRGTALINYTRKLQPDILINDRSGAGGDYSTPEQRIGASQFDRPWETCMTIADQWAWKPNDKAKSLKQCIDTLVRCAGGDGNLLFNVGPTAEGEIEPAQVKRLKEMGAWLKQYGQSIYATRGGPWLPSESVASTRKGNTIYVHVLKWKDEPIVLPPLPRKILRSSVLTGGTAIVRQDDRGVTLIVPPEYRRDPVTIIKLDLNGSALKIPVIPGTGPLVTASNIFQNDDSYAAASAVDGNADTRWATDEGVKQAWLELNYGRPITFAGVRIKEHFDRVRQFQIQVQTGGQWKTVFSGTTIGDKFEQKFDKQTARVIRLNILDATNGPSIDEFEPIEAIR